MTLRVLSLFAGIGGFDLGLERTGGFKTVAFCEISDFCRRVLAKHWPEVPCYEDVKELTGERLAADGIAVDVIVGGFPCQDISSAGNRTGIEGDRSGLWSEYARLIGELRPRYVIVENVSDLLSRGIGRVLGDLAALGYDAEWHCIPASAVGAPHRRDRVWIIAYPHREGKPACSVNDEAPRMPAPRLAYAARELLHGSRGTRQSGRPEPAICGWWEAEPQVGRVVDGLPGRTHRLRALGNAVVPQIPELIGRAILAAIADTHPEDGDVQQAPLVSGGGARSAIARRKP